MAFVHYFINHNTTLILQSHNSVEVHNDDWWRMRWEAAGFVYSEHLTSTVRATAMKDSSRKDLTLDMKEENLYFVGQHIYMNAQVFINPMVASLPEHAHLFAEVSFSFHIYRIAHVFFV